MSGAFLNRLKIIPSTNCWSISVGKIKAECVHYAIGNNEHFDTFFVNIINLNISKNTVNKLKFNIYAHRCT